MPPRPWPCSAYPCRTIRRLTCPPCRSHAELVPGEAALPALRRSGLTDSTSRRSARRRTARRHPGSRPGLRTAWRSSRAAWSLVCTPPSSGRSCSRTRRSGPGIRTARTQGSLCPWNMVPSMGVNVLPQPWQRHLWTLLPSVPHLPMRMEPQKGRRSLRIDAEEGDLLLGKERRVPVRVHAPVALHDCRIGIAPLLSACGGSPSWPGGRRRLGLPHRKSAAARHRALVWWPSSRIQLLA